MNSNDTLPPVEPSLSGGGAGAAEGDAGDLWPTAGPAKGLRIRLPIAVAALAVMALVGAAAGASLKKSSSTTAVQAGAVGGNRAAGASAPNGATAGNGIAPNGVGGRAGGPGGGVVGTVTKVDENTVTLTQRDGTTATVVVPSGTTVSKTVSGSLSDVTAGTTIAVRGTTADGKTTAESITINPANGAGFGPGGLGAPPAQPGAAGGN